MRILKKKFLFKLIAAICLMLTLFNFWGQNRVYAKNEYWGGVLIDPMINLLTALGDSIMEIMHKSIQTQNVALIKINSSKSANILAYIAAALAFVVVTVIFIAITGGIGAGIISAFSELLTKAAIVNIVLQTAEIAIVGGTFVGITSAVGVTKAMIPEDIYLPLFSITPEEIFSDSIALFDVNFFDVDSEKYYIYEVTERPDYSTEVDKDEEIITPSTFTIWDLVKELASENEEDKYDNIRKEAEELENQTITVGEAKQKSFKEMIEEVNSKLQNDQEITDDMNMKITIQKFDTDTKLEGPSMRPTSQTNTEKSNYIFEIIKNNEEYLYITNKFIRVSYYKYKNIYDPSSGVQSWGTGKAESIKKTQSLSYELATTKTEDGEDKIGTPFDKYVTQKKYITSTAAQLQNIVSTWYFILRNIALLVLMLVLIYTGIRIVIGSTAGEKAKYKERLVDWVVALCLVFIMHYIMVFANELVGKITELVKNSTVNGNAAYIELTNDQWDNAKETLNGYDEKIVKFSDENTKAISWTTDLAGIYRIQSQATDEGTSAWVGFSICYFVLVLFTLFFAFTYAKRVVYMAFLTIIAPLVAMTYPLDKITDGKAQAFDSWLKEYIFNLMIQPLHLLLYTILVSSAYALASESPIYALVAVGFMMPAEKLLRRFFGFEKAKTPGLLGGAAGAALMMSGLQKLTGHHRQKGKGGPGGSRDKDEDDSGDIRLTSEEGVDPYKTKMNASPSKSDEEEAKARRGETHMYKGSDGTEYEQFGLFGPQSQSALVAPAAPTPTTSPSKGDSSTSKFGKWKEDAKNKISNSASLRVLKAGASAYGRGMKKKFVRSLERGRPVRALARTASGVAGAALGLGVATAAATASGDPNNIIKYGSLAATAGYSGASNLSDSVSDFFSAPNEREIATEMEREAYGEDYASHLLEQDEENNLMTENNISRIRTLTNWSRSEAEEFLETHGRDCYRSGVKNVDDMLAVQNAVENGKIDSEEQAIAAMKLKNSTVKDTKSLTADKIDKWKKTIASTFDSKLRQEHEGQEGWDDDKFKTESLRLAQSYIDDFKTLDSELSGIRKV